jgi:hypothetical protein
MKAILARVDPPPRAERARGAGEADCGFATRSKIENTATPTSVKRVAAAR